MKIEDILKYPVRKKQRVCAVQTLKDRESLDEAHYTVFLKTDVVLNRGVHRLLFLSKDSVPACYFFKNRAPFNCSKDCSKGIPWGSRIEDFI